MSGTMPRGQQIDIQPNCSGYSRRQLPEEGVRGIDVQTLPVLRLQQSALLRLLARIVA